MVRCEDMMGPGMEEDDSEDEVGVSGAAAHKAKPRRKSHQRPQGSDQIRQAFSKRKKGLVLKAYQLNALTDAKVFMFIVNDKGTSWAYATPGFAASLNQELMRELRLLAQVPEHAKLITEVMPDPPNVRTTDSAVAEHPALRRPEQALGSYSAPCTRTATGALAARSRSSYSGGSAGEPPMLLGSGLALGRSGSTTTQARMHSAAQSDEQSPTRPRARPASGSSIAASGHGARASSTAGQLMQLQQYGGRFGMEPPTPCGVYNLMGQPLPANGTCTESPTLLSEVAASCGSPGCRVTQPRSSQQQQMMMAAAAGGAGGMQLSEAVLQQWQQQAMTSGGMQWIPQQGWDMNLQQQDSNLQQQDLSQQQQGGWVKPELVGGVQLQGEAAGGADCQQMAGMCGNIGQDSAAAAAWEQQQQQGGGFAGSNAGSSGHPNGGAFECLQRVLPPLRVGKAGRGSAAGPHSAPAGAVNTLMGQPSDWVDFEVKETQLHVLSDMAVYGASSSGYSSYGPSPTYAAAGQGGIAAAAADGSGGEAPAAAFMLPPDTGSADPSPTAALGHRLSSALAVESPQHPSVQQQQQPMYFGVQQAAQGWGAAQDCRYNAQGQQQQRDATTQLMEQQELFQQEQQQQQQHNQGAYIPRTDDLVSDPLMELLMDQATQQHQQQLSSQNRPRSHRGQQHMSIMYATLQQPLPQQQQQRHVDQQQQQQPASSYLDIQCNTAAAAAAAAGQPRQLVHVASMLDHLPVPRKNASEAERAAWAEQVKQVLDSLPSQQRSQFIQMVTEKTRESQTCEAMTGVMAAPGGSNGFGVSGSNVCSPVLSSAANNTGSTTAAGTAAAMAAAAAAGCGGYTPRLPGGASLQQGGKQRHGPSRLSATSPAIESAGAGGAAPQAGAGGSGLDPTANDLNAGMCAMPFWGPGSGYCVSYGMVAPGMSGSGAGLMGMPPAVSGARAGSTYYAAAASMGLVSGYSPTMMQMPASMDTATMMMCQQQQQEVDTCVGMTAPAMYPQSMVPPPTAQQPAAAAYSAPIACEARDVDNGDTGMCGDGSGLLGDVLAGRAAAGDAGRVTCSSPLKRSQPCSFGLLSGLGDGDDAMSPLKRTCRDLLPEPPSFATLMQTEDVEEDAVAWAAAGGGHESLQGLPSCASLGRAIGPLNTSGSLPGFINVTGCEVVAAQMAEEEAVAAARESGGAAVVGMRQPKQQQEDGDC